MEILETNHNIKAEALVSHHRPFIVDRDQMGFDGQAVPQQIYITTLMIVYAVGIVAYIFVNALRELFQVYQQKWHYLFEMNSIIAWFLYISSLIMVLPVFSGGAVTDMHYSAASVTVFLSWFNLLLFLQRFDQVIQKLIKMCGFKILLSFIIDSGWHIRCNVFGNSTNTHQSADGLLDTNHRFRPVLLHPDVQGNF